MNDILLDPTAELSDQSRPTFPRQASLEGKTIGLLDINKPRGKQLLDRLQTRFEERGAIINRYSKPTMTRVAPLEVKQQIANECDAVVEALAD
jgi:hypothetical protein